jgi:signal transduction histidine kinase
VLFLDTQSTLKQAVSRGLDASKFTEDHLHLASAIAHQAAIAVEESRYHEALVYAERLAAVGQTIATLSHHIKNILQGLRSGSYLVNMGLDGHQLPLVEQGWKVVQKNQDKIYNLVMDMLSYSKEREPTFDLVDINQLVGDVVELLKGRMDELNIRLSLELDTSIDRLAMDSDGIHRVLLNILSNAIDALGEVDGLRSIDIKTELSGNGRYLHLSVQDNGPGIPEPEQERIFQIFHSTKGSKGTGLGLAVSQKIVHEHGGQIRLDSQTDKGACFVIEMPARRELPSVDALPSSIVQAVHSNEED